MRLHKRKSQTESFLGYQQLSVFDLADLSDLNDKLKRICEDYSSGKSVAEVAIAHGVSSSTVRRKLGLSGIKTDRCIHNEGLKSKSKITELYSEYKDGKTISHIAKELKVSSSAIRHHFRRLGLPTLTKEESAHIRRKRNNIEDDCSLEEYDNVDWDEIRGIQPLKPLCHSLLYESSYCFN